ncbi:MAG: SDR family NAD(P)-dependent oxidoreductase [Armatimonadota bacterium]|nr:SDR family oxidoreductase [bacterium]
MNLNLQGKTAIVTGAAQGIGKAIAEELVECGASVVVADMDADLGQATASELGENAVFMPCNIANYSDVTTLIDGTVERFGKLDIMVNNAGSNSSRQEDRLTTDKFPLELWQKLIDVNLSGTFYCCRTAAAKMVEQKSGSIINISSIAGVVALQLQVGFVATKAAMIKMTEAMACELGPLGVRVNTVSPGSIVTQITKKLFYNDPGKSEHLMTFIPQRRPGETNEVGSVVAFLASDAASYINGQNIIVDGGWTCGFSRNF